MLWAKGSGHAVDSDKQDVMRLELAAALGEATEARTSAAALARDSMRALFLINGGAVVALLAMLGNLKKDSVLAVSLLWLRVSLVCFAVGVVAAVVASIQLWMFYDSLDTFEKSRATHLFKGLGHHALHVSATDLKGGFKISFDAVRSVAISVAASVLSFVLGAGAALLIFGGR